MEKSISARFDNECLRLLKYSNELADAIANNLPAEKVAEIKEKTDTLRKNIKLSYSTKFNSGIYSNRINSVKALLDGNKENIVIEKFTKKLAKVVEIMESGKGDYVKVQALTDIYSTHTELINDYVDLIPELLYTPFMSRLSEATDLMKANYKNLADINYDKKLVEFNKFYDYSRFIIHEYFNADNEDKNKFLKKYGITEENFDYCVKVVKYLDVDLYNQYLMIENLRKIDKIKKVIDSIDYIYESIQFEKNEKAEFDSINNDKTIKWLNKSIRDSLFNDIDFLKANQFKDTKSFSVDFPNKARKYVMEASESIIDSTEKQNFIDSYYKKIADIKTYMSTYPDTITRNLKDISKDETSLYNYLKIQKILVSKSEIDIVLAYMRANELPFTQTVFDFVAKEYINSRLDLTSISLEDYEPNNINDCIIIPSKYEQKVR